MISFYSANLAVAESIWAWGSGSDPLAIQCYGRCVKPGWAGFLWHWELSTEGARDLLRNLETETHPSRGARRAARLLRIMLREQAS